jgi:hypothetical protein
LYKLLLPVQVFGTTLAYETARKAFDALFAWIFDAAAADTGPVVQEELNRAVARFRIDLGVEPVVANERPTPTTSSRKPGPGFSFSKRSRGHANVPLLRKLARLLWIDVDSYSLDHAWTGRPRITDCSQRGFMDFRDKNNGMYAGRQF